MTDLTRCEIEAYDALYAAERLHAETGHAIRRLHAALESLRCESGRPQPSQDQIRVMGGPGGGK